MATFSVTSPKGERFKITAPDDASESDVLAYAQHQFAQQKATEQKAAFEADRDRRQRELVAEMSWPEKWAANWSAGYGNLDMGMRQLLAKVGIGRGPSDEEIQEKRRIDSYLKEGNWGLGVMQGTSEILPTMAIPGAAFARPVQVATKVVPMGPVTQLLAAGGVGGATGAALSPTTSKESRGANMAAGGALGVVLPGAGAAAPSVVRGVRNMLTESGAGARAVDAIVDGMSPAQIAALAERLRTPSGPTLKGKQVDVPTSSAQATGNAHLAQKEAYSRSQPGTQPAWADFDAAQNAARHDVLTSLSPSELRLERFTRVRDLATSPMRETALKEAATREFVTPIMQHVSDVMQGATSANPAVRNVMAYVTREIWPEAGVAVTPARLYEVRKVLAEKLGGRPAIGDELGASAKAARRETSALIAAIDDALAGGAKEGSTWGRYLTEFAERSKPITSGRAMRDVVEKIEQKPLLGDAPQITGTGLRQALEQKTGGRYGDKLMPDVRTDTDNLLQSIKEAEAAGRTRKLSATMGGQSITNSDQLLAKTVSSFIHALPGVGGYAQRVGQINRAAVDQHMARLLQSPIALGEALRALPPDRLQGVYGEVLRASGVSAGAEAAKP
jgi:hypothetical protein